MKKLISGVLALCMISSFAVSASFAAGNAAKGDSNGDGSITIKDFVSLQKYILGEETKISSSEADINEDGKINIIDLISLKNIFTVGYEKPLVDTEAVAEMNGYAESIYSAAKQVQKFMAYSGSESYGSGKETVVYTNDDSSEFSGMIKDLLKIPKDMRWKVCISNSRAAGCMCSLNEITAAYPNVIPMTLDIGFDDADDQHTEYYCDVTVDWKEIYPDKITEEQSVKDYLPKSTAEMNKTAEEIFNAFEKFLTYGGHPAAVKADGLDAFMIDEYSVDPELVKAVYRLAELNPENTKFTFLLGADKQLKECICTDSYETVTGSYPHPVPQNMNVPFTNDNIERFLKSEDGWKSMAAEYTSADPVQSALPDYPEKTVTECNNAAKKIFSDAVKKAEEYETAGVTVPDGVYSQQDELFAGLGTPGIEYLIYIKDYTVASCIASDYTMTKSGCYPYLIPQPMNIPFVNIKNISPDIWADRPDWKQLFPDCILKDNSYQASLTDYPSLTTEEYNQIARKLFNDIQLKLSDYEARGFEAKNGLFTSEDEFFKEFDTDYYDFSVYIMNNVVFDVMAGCADRSGAYPHTVPVIMNVPLTPQVLNDIARNQADFDWKKAFPDRIGDLFTADLPDIRPESAFVSDMNADAKVLFNYAQTAAKEAEANGETVDGIFESSSAAPGFAMVLKLSCPDISNWAVRVENNVVTGAVTGNGSKLVSGAYPCSVPESTWVTFKGYDEHCQTGHDRSEWETLGRFWTWDDMLF